MKIYTKRFESLGKDPKDIKFFAEDVNEKLLRFAIVEIISSKPKKYIVEASILRSNKYQMYNLEEITTTSNDFVVVNVVPTGVRADVGGYIADATPVVNTMSKVADIVVTHPNVVNGSLINYMKDNVLYVEGHHLDNFLQGKIALRPVTTLNKIGVVIDRGAIDVDKDSVNMVINTIEALRVVAGIDVIGYKITDQPIGGHAIKMESGAFCGEVLNPQTLIDATSYLISKGATAIAIATYIRIEDIEKDLDKYFKGELANPFGGVEALISHLISSIFGIPCAHAPILPKWEKEYYESIGIVDPRASSEVVSPGYLGCILKGLSFAPRISDSGITIKNVKAIVIPYSCCGGIPAFASQVYHIPLICVKENKTVMKVTPELMKFKNVFIVENYWEAIGIITAMKAGIAPETLRRPFKAIEEI